MVRSLKAILTALSTVPMFAHILHRSLVFLAASLCLLLGLSAIANAEPVSCGGIDLLAKMKREDRKTYDQILAEGRKIPNARGLFWKIEKRGFKPSYLFGTMHVSDPRVIKLPHNVKKAHLKAKVIVLESDQLLELGKARLLAFTKPDMMMMPAGKRIEDFLTPEQRGVVDTALTARGAPLSAVNYLRPWMVTSIVASACEQSRAKDRTPVLDQQLALDAIENNIPLKGLETLEEQYGALNKMSLEAQVKNLISAIAHPEQFANIDETMLRLYLSGDIRPLAPLLRWLSQNDTTMAADSFAEFEDEVITRRNHTMADRAKPFLQDGNAFIAVGALHVQGDDGLVELFRKQGFKVTPAI